ncbi:hypothetical protein SR1949_49500 [Sphaerospermopsis reniformis]|uniref:Uncharacterized protein n=1 Tax=Sphaerospermopsis reniformis TaxID=531300 RepID=A0A480A461_9CYAN|nr:hypothetical protein [Sphaerospermopsis reniformis]GCL39820.1 hypothetical protein SR1949_49500 [Sphaerospermopsis reniformis]
MQQSLLVKIATIGLLSVGSSSVIAGSFLFTQTVNNTATAQIIADISRYSEIRNHKWSDLNQIKHFPIKITRSDQFISLAYSPGWKQGSNFFQIRLKRPPEQIQKSLSHYSKIAGHKYWGGDTNDHIKQAEGVPTTFFYTGKSDNLAFPSTYQILVFKAQDQGKPGFKWNHGHSYGVAIDSSASEIIYWVEKW